MFLRKENKLYIYECDWCKKEIKSRTEKLTETVGCSRSCGSKASRATVKRNLLEKYGVENVSQLKEVRDKVKQTCFEKYGTQYSFQAEPVKNKIKETCLERYGVEYPTQSEFVKDKVKETCLKRYGVEHPWMSDEIRDKSAKTMIDRYGVDNPQQNEEIKAKTQETCLKKYGTRSGYGSPQTKLTIQNRYGVDNVSQIESIKEKKVANSLKKWGFKHPTQSPEVQRKIINSYLKKSKGFVSASELRCLNYLKQIYGNVDHQVCINGWIIDFYIKSVDTYIQFDGIYWHGLDKSQYQLQNPISKRDRDISAKWHRDREQERWFTLNDKNLIRIREDEFKIHERENTVQDWLKMLNCFQVDYGNF